MSKTKLQQPQTLTPEPTVTQSQIKRQELEALTDAALDEKYEQVFLTKGPEMSREAVIDALMEHTPTPPTLTPEAEEPAPKGNTFFGKGDKDQKYPIDNANKNHVVARLVRVEQNNGGMIEVPNTEQVQTFYPEQFDQLVKDEFFSKSMLKVDILHKP